MKYKDPITGELRDVIIKSGDTLPIGTIVDFDGDVIPDGYEEATEVSDVVNSLEGNEIYRAPSVKAVNEVLNGNKPMGSIVVEDITCKNLFPMPSGGTSNGVTLTVNDDGTFNLKGTATARADFLIFVSNKNTKIVSGETYTLSANKSLDAGAYAMVETYNGSTWVEQALSIGSSTNPATGAINLTGTQVRFMIRVTQGNTVDMENVGVQLEKGSVATNYVEHKEYENKEIYSTSEQVIGTWIDGTPIYRKVITWSPTEIIGEKGAYTVQQIAHGISNFKQIVDAKAFNSTQHVLPTLGGTAAAEYGTCVAQIDDYYINMRLVNDTWGPRTWYFVLEYTKTTD